jgi:hypothetical protein
MSYPDLVEEDGRFWVTETQKNVGRVHEIDRDLLDGLFGQRETAAVPARGLVLDLPGDRPVPREASMPRLPEFHARDNSRPDYGGKDLRAGFSIAMWLTLESLRPGQVILDSRAAAGNGILVAVTDRGTVGVTLSDGRSRAGWDSDPGAVEAGKLHHLVITVDGGPKIVTFVVDGVLGDGGDARQFGWGRFSPTLRSPHGAPTLKIAPGMNGSVRSVRLYDHPLRTSEAVGSYQAARGHRF